MKTIVALPGEGIGIEVVEAACEVLEGTGVPLKILHPPQGAAALKNHGTPIPHDAFVLEQADPRDDGPPQRHDDPPDVDALQRQRGLPHP